MNAKPQPGRRAVGGATLHPRDALTDAVAGPLADAPRRPSAARPADALLAAMAWYVNQTIARQVEITYAWADLARTHAKAVAKAVESNWPEGHLRKAAELATDAYVGYADETTKAASRFGRHFGHLAFAFRRPG
jgi:hypothetical protein